MTNFRINESRYSLKGNIPLITRKRYRRALDAANRMRRAGMPALTRDEIKHSFEDHLRNPRYHR